MRRARVLLLIVVSGMLLVFYNNCGRPASLKQTAQFLPTKAPAEKGKTEGYYDTYQLVATSAGVVVSLQVSPAQILVFPATSSEPISCSWDALLDRGATSLREVGGMEALSFSFTGGVCQIEVRADMKEEAQPKDVWQTPQEICFNFEGTLPICQTFQQTQLPETSIRRIKAEMHIQRSREGSGDRLFDSQNG